MQKQYPDKYETWFFFPGPGLGWDPYRDFINNTLKTELDASQHDKHNWHSAPCVWLEKSDGAKELLGGGDRFREWAVRTFSQSDPGNRGILSLATREPSVMTDEFFDDKDTGAAGQR
mmetsp:Transcript_25643/g.50506  ORF Transcript_25643/g.50506 Transcript_25643/m.50506 type:complete len:117 (-) Transcript_25643:240-590(-)|eukprot:CAMPEP_0175145502 /NCGR_PEP_ID=MMETSP0087-20121206/14814_1 /TAXON_ID=136419 /ORGANISM="Unknown Unknown, Strain D1" /LENGTH=116 /DNA_ID=CAMNT_0016430271 /DNA_START=169 /DNA_END=519 /DNA_ORIENTATION=-